MAQKKRGIATVGVHGGVGGHGESGAPVVPPIVQSATFFGGTSLEEELLYSRYGNNPNQSLLAEKVAEMEGTEASLPVASGMAATALTLLALTEQGDHVVASRHLYGATAELLTHELPRRGVQTTLVDPNGAEAWEGAVRPETKLFFFEVPTNPTLRVPDPRPVVRVAREHDLTTVVDATFASPLNLRPAELGVDVVIHSATKYLGGHSDLIAGVVSGSRDFVDRVTRMLKLYGPALDPHAAWLLDRGLRTLDVRVRRQNENAMALARFLEGHPASRDVIYPGLASHPDHAVAAELLDGFGGMVAVVFDGGGDAADRVMASLRLALVAPSLGGVETLVCQPRFTSHTALTPEERAAAGMPDGFLRISVGVEDPADLVEDFAQALGDLS